MNGIAQDRLDSRQVTEQGKWQGMVERMAMEQNMVEGRPRGRAQGGGQNMW